MDARRTLMLAAGGVALAAVGVAVVVVARARRSGPAIAPPGVVDAEGRNRRGTPEDRGRSPAYALDVEQLKTREDLDPVVQYLTFIQSQRGEQSHLLFVRYEDIDAMAALDGVPVPDFLSRLDQLGVVVSNN